MTSTTIAPPARPNLDEQPWRPFRVRVAALNRMSPSFVRITFTGDDLDAMGHDGPDQRIKVYIPGGDDLLIPDISPDEWYEQYRQADPATRGAVRTYTIGAVRPSQHEVDVDFVLHGETGPASRWANRARIGDEVALVGPNRRFGADCQGHEWHPPADAQTIVIAGDETAVPAITGILRSMQSWHELPRRVHVALEVPEAADILDIAPPAGVEVEWLIRNPTAGARATNGDLLVNAVRNLDLAPPTSDSRVPDAGDFDNDFELPWEIADSNATNDGFYAWVAGEAGAVKAIRRYLVRERSIDRRNVTFMGYWRLGRSEE
jgi:NADPH-dependent ferric siderophore reductase